MENNLFELAVTRDACRLSNRLGGIVTLKEAAEVYVDLVRLEQSLAPDQHQARQEVHALRSKYHDALADVMRDAGIVYSDRFEVASRAFELLANEK